MSTVHSHMSEPAAFSSLRIAAAGSTRKQVRGAASQRRFGVSLVAEILKPEHSIQIYVHDVFPNNAESNVNLYEFRFWRIWDKHGQAEKLGTPLCQSSHGLHLRKLTEMQLMLHGPGFWPWKMPVPCQCAERSWPYLAGAKMCNACNEKRLQLSWAQLHMPQRYSKILNLKTLDKNIEQHPWERDVKDVFWKGTSPLNLAAWIGEIRGSAIIDAVDPLAPCRPVGGWKMLRCWDHG